MSDLEDLLNRLINKGDSQLRVANLRANVIRLALSNRTGKLALLRMFEAGVEGRKEASEIGRRKASEYDSRKKENEYL